MYSIGVVGILLGLGTSRLNDRIRVIEFVLVVGHKTVLDALYNDATEAGCTGSLAASTWMRRMHRHSPIRCDHAP
jgi:hypothetical protein